MTSTRAITSLKKRRATHSRIVAPMLHRKFQDDVSVIFRRRASASFLRGLYKWPLPCPIQPLCSRCRILLPFNGVGKHSHNRRDE